MGANDRTAGFLLNQYELYPLCRPEDLMKGLYQSVFGPGHMLLDTDRAMRYMDEELKVCDADKGPYIEPLCGEFARVHLKYLAHSGLGPRTLFKLFEFSAGGGPGSAGNSTGSVKAGPGGAADSPEGAGDTPGGAAELSTKLSVLTELIRERKLPFNIEDVASSIESWRSEGFPARHHSSAFTAAYAPHYRLISLRYIPYLPVLGALDRLMSGKERVIAAIDGGSASGKPTLAALLKDIYGCGVCHIDDFFLRPSEQTPERLMTPAGNIDRERLIKEVLRPLSLGETVSCRPYDCMRDSFVSAYDIPPGPLSIVEGAYSMHPDFAGYYDLSVFLNISPELQRERIMTRNTEPMQSRFFGEWIPMEERYFAMLNPRGRADIIAEVG